MLKKFKHEFYTSCLLGALKFTKNDDPNKYEYSGYGTRFDTHQQMFLSNGEWDENTVILGVDNSSSVHIDNKKIYLSSWWRPNRWIRWWYNNSRGKMFSKYY